MWEEPYEVINYRFGIPNLPLEFEGQARRSYMWHEPYEVINYGFGIPNLPLEFEGQARRSEIWHESYKVINYGFGIFELPLEFESQARRLYMWHEPYEVINYGFGISNLPLEFEGQARRSEIWHEPYEVINYGFEIFELPLEFKGQARRSAFWHEPYEVIKYNFIFLSKVIYRALYRKDEDTTRRSSIWSPSYEVIYYGFYPDYFLHSYSEKSRRSEIWHEPYEVINYRFQNVLAIEKPSYFYREKSRRSEMWHQLYKVRDYGFEDPWLVINKIKTRTRMDNCFSANKFRYITTDHQYLDYNLFSFLTTELDKDIEIAEILVGEKQRVLTLDNYIYTFADDYDFRNDPVEYFKHRGITPYKRCRPRPITDGWRETFVQHTDYQFVPPWLKRPYCTKFPRNWCKRKKTRRSILKPIFYHYINPNGYPYG